jgi:hypothetical protein
MFNESEISEYREERSRQMRHSHKEHESSYHGRDDRYFKQQHVDYHREDN